MWLQFWLWVATFILSDYFRERLPQQTPAGVGDFNIPTATEGRYVAIVPGGTVPINSPNCVWYGDYAAVERTVTTGVIFKEDETIGFTYELALQYALFRGECFGITRVWIGDDEVFEYVADAAGIPQTVVDVDRNDLFGGEDEGGGFIGRIRLFAGSQTQAVSTYLAGELDPLSAYRGYSYIVVTDPTETKGANIGESPNLRYIRVEVQTFSTLAQTGLGNRLGLTSDEHIIGRDANPIAVAYEIYLNEDWGRNFPGSDVNLTNFRAVASTIFAEGIGYSELIDGVTTTGELIDKIEQHIDGYIGPNPVTGQIEVTLARFDYTLANEFQADGVTVLEVSKWDKGDWSQTFNQLRCKYSDRDKKYKDTYALAQAAGNRVITGRLKSKDIEYAGVHDKTVANLIVARDMRGLAQPIGSGTLILDRTAYLLRPGSVLSFTDTQAAETDQACRVTKVTIGGPHRNAVQVEIVQDVFDTEITAVADPPASDFVLPVQSVVPFAVADQVALEAPFIITQQDPISPETFPRGFTMARLGSGGSPTRYEVTRRTRTPPTGFSGIYTSSDFITGGFMVAGILRNVETAWQSGNGTLTMQVDPITGSLDFLIGTFAPGGVGQMTGVAVINPNTATEEWVAFTSVVDDLAGIRLEGLYRACLDRAMHAHGIGDRIWFIWTGGAGLPAETYTPADAIDFKFLPTSPSDSVLEPAATSLAEVLLVSQARYTRPLLPVELLFNTVSFPAIVDFDVAITGGPGLEIIPTYRFWRVIHVVNSVAGRSESGTPIVDSDFTGETLRVSVWLFNLDTDPTPVRGDAVATIIDQAVTTQGDPLRILRSVLSGAGIVSDFNARIEIETKHSPTGEPADQVSYEPLFFDFFASGEFEPGYGLEYGENYGGA